jgi:hypothetical protein
VSSIGALPPFIPPKRDKKTKINFFMAFLKQLSMKNENEQFFGLF